MAGVHHAGVVAVPVGVQMVGLAVLLVLLKVAVLVVLLKVAVLVILLKVAGPVDGQMVVLVVLLKVAVPVVLVTGLRRWPVGPLGRLHEHPAPALGSWHHFPCWTCSPAAASTSGECDPRSHRQWATQLLH
mgnify:CR=1 FL=1